MEREKEKEKVSALLKQMCGLLEEEIGLNRNRLLPVITLQQVTSWMMIGLIMFLAMNMLTKMM